MTKLEKIAMVVLLLGVAAAVPLCFAPAEAQPTPFCQPGQACKTLSLSTTRPTGAGVSLSGDAGVHFGDGTVLNTASLNSLLPTQSANKPLVSNGTTTSFATLAIAGGGTGQTSAQAAVDAILPAQGSASGKFLTSNGSASSWGTVTSGSTSGFGAYASRPAAGTAGNLYTCSDCPVTHWVDTGSAWAPIVGGMSVGTQPEAASNLGTSFVRSGGTVATLIDQNGSLRLTYGVDNGGSNSTRASGFVESLSSSTMHVETSCTPELLPGTNISNGFDSCGVVMRESSSGKLATIWLMSNYGTANQGTTIVEAAYFSAPQTRTTSSSWPIGLVQRVFVRLERSGTNILFRTSTDSGTTWNTLISTATATIFSSAPDQVGIVGGIYGTTDAITADFFHYVSGS